MKVSRTTLFLFLFQIISCSEVHYEVPQPAIEVFSPKGLTISIPDSKNVEAVEFTLGLPGVLEPLTGRVEGPTRGLWLFWNPNAAVGLHQKIYFKVVVRHEGAYRKREGVHVVERILSLSSRSNDTDCLEEGEEGQKIISGFPSLEESERQMISSGKTSNFKSSYSMYKNSGLKPITKSSTSTTSGTFYMQPSGVVEASGYKSGSTFDSTKSEGEQWKHYKSELTPEELENMRHRYGAGHFASHEFDGQPPFPRLPYTPFADLIRQHKFGKASPVTHEFHETHETRETSYNLPMTDGYRFADSARKDAAVTKTEGSENHYRLGTGRNEANARSSQGTVFRATEYVREEHGAPEESTRMASAATSASQMSRTGGAYFTHDREYAPVRPSAGQTRESDFNSAAIIAQENGRDYSSQHYAGNIFKSVKSSKAKYPQDCALTSGIDYVPLENVREVEKLTRELSCLATIAEDTVKMEINSLKRRNADLSRKLELLEQNLNRMQSTCNCGQ